MFLVFDSEGDDLLPNITKFHCFVFSTLAMDKWFVFANLDEIDPEWKRKKSELLPIEWMELSEVGEWIAKEPKAIACHNLFGFDLPAMRKLGYIDDYDLDPDTIDGSPCKIFDTLGMSRVLNPERRLPFGCPHKMYNEVTGKMDTLGPHGLAAWGYKFNNEKPKVDDWRNQPIEVYLHRCIEDVKINIFVWKELMREMQDKAKPTQTDLDWKAAMRLANQAFYSMCEQEIAGVPFNRDLAERLVIRIDKMMADIADDVEPKLPERVLPKSKQPNFPKNPFKGNGEISSDGWKYITKLGYNVNQDAFNLEKIPAKPFKGDGSLAKTGEKFCETHGIEGEDACRSFINNLREEQAKCIPLSADELEAARKDLLDEKIVILKAPMRLSNQDDIKRWMVTEGGWVPLVWNTKDITRDIVTKIPTPLSDQFDKVNTYIDNIVESVYKKFVYREMGFNFETEIQRNGRDSVVDKLMKKARYLVTTPKLKDEKGDLCKNLEKLDKGLAGQIVKWLSLRNRRSTLRALDEKKETGWLNNPRLDVDGRLPASSSGLTNTCRQKHRICVNVPKADPKVLFGEEFRSLFYAPDGWVFMGYDGAALEQRVAGWYTWDYDDGWYAGLIIDGDSHTKNAEAYSEAAGITVTRSSGKNITYGILYGATAPKVAKMLGISVERAAMIVDAFWDINWSLKLLRDDLIAYWEETGKKYIPGIDGRKIFTRSKHSLLNCLFQSCGAITMDLAGELLRKKLRDEGLQEDCVRVLYMHDEYQFLIKKHLIEHKVFKTKEEAEEYDDGRIWSNVNSISEDKHVRYYARAGELASQCIEEAGKQLGSPLPITADYDIGMNWAATH